MSYLTNLILKKRYFVGALLAAILFIIYLPNIASLSLGQDERVFLDFAIITIYLFSVISAAVYGFSRPIKQALAQTLLLNVSLFLIVFLVSWQTYQAFNSELLLAEVLILPEMLIFLIIGLFLAKFTTKKVSFAKISLFSLIIVFLILISATTKYISRFEFGPHRTGADIVWLATVQYYGDLNNSPYPKAEKYLNLTTALDPRFCRPYSFGLISFFDKDKIDRAIALGKKGVKNCPDDWAISFFLGASYNKNNNVEQAAYYFDLAASAPTAPDQLKTSASDYRKNNGLVGDN